MMSRQLSSSRNEHGVEDDVHFVESASQEEKGVITEDGEYSVSIGSDAGAPAGLGAKQKAAQEERSTLGKKESQAIVWLRLTVLSCLVFVALIFIVSSLMFQFVARKDGYNDLYEEYVSQVQERCISELERKLDAANTLSTEMTTHAKVTGKVFPFVTFENFEFMGANARIAGDTVMIFYLPYITSDLKDPWETYAAANLGHDQSAYDSEQISKAVQDMMFGEDPHEINGLGLQLIQASQPHDTSKIWLPGDYNNTTHDPPYFPIWHITPQVSFELLNLDMGRYDFLKGALEVSVDTEDAVFDVFTTLFDNDDGVDTDAAVFDLILQNGQYRHQNESYGNDPMSALIYPVFDGFGQDRKVVGVLFNTVYWRFMLMGILPTDSTDSLVYVFENSRGQKETYEITGANAKYCKEDHDCPYDVEYVYGDVDELNLVTEFMLSAGPESRSFTSAAINSQYLNYTLRVYPSTKLKKDYFAYLWLNSVVLTVIFGVVIWLFLLYDRYVQRRQTIVLERAVRAAAVVSSLYPANVREQIINDGCKDPLDTSERTNAFLRSKVEESVSTTTPLATKYPNCTVYFADLAGFTKWSSTRQPGQVFELLEALFREFDALAAKRGVFKVETIGDCYMAVTGLPNAQPDHAVLMAKFAHDCMIRLDRVVERLTSTLGEGTDDLALRTGLHSGEVTAGVLRGEKGRFQLFGDTVNTASRMESTGTPRKIQVSQSTADALILRGKQHWLVPRREKVFAKGKGEMQTYFLEMGDQSEKTHSTNSSSNGSRPNRINSEVLNS